MTYDWPTQLSYSRLGELNRLLDKLYVVDSNLKNKNEFSDVDEYKMLFSAFIIFSRAVTFSLQFEGKKMSPSFSAWYEERKQEMIQYDFLRYILHARNRLEKTGLVPLAFNGQHNFLMGVGFRKSDGARFYAGSQGAFWVQDEKTSDQVDIPVKPNDEEVREYSSIITVELITIPKTDHNPECLPPFRDPMHLCSEALKFYRGLVYNFNKNILNAFDEN